MHLLITTYYNIHTCQSTVLHTECSVTQSLSKELRSSRAFYYVFGCKCEIVGIRGGIGWLAAGALPNSFYNK